MLPTDAIRSMINVDAVGPDLSYLRYASIYGYLYHRPIREEEPLRDDRLIDTAALKTRLPTPDLE